MKKTIIAMFSKVGILGIILAGMLACSAETDKQPNKAQFGEYYSDEYARDCHSCDINIIKVRNCEYVLWHNGYGSDMEHYEGCQNKEHYGSN